MFPEDSELNQSVKGFYFLMTAPNKMVDRKGTIVLMSSSYEGRGYPSLTAETGARLYINLGDGVIWRALVKRRNVYFFSPNISKRALYHFFPKSVKLLDDWDKLLEELSKIHGDSPKAAVFPRSIQLSE